MSSYLTFLWPCGGFLMAKTSARVAKLIRAIFFLLFAWQRKTKDQFESEGFEGRGEGRKEASKGKKGATKTFLMTEGEEAKTNQEKEERGGEEKGNRLEKL